VRSNVAIIGAGPSGLAAARYLRAHGFPCTLFEQAPDIGGQWNAASPYSGVWPGMRTNTSRVLTCFSDQPHERGSAIYPTNEEMLAYLKRYADRFEVPQARLNTRVKSVDRSARGYTVTFTSGDGTSAEEFERVVVATGRYNQPCVPSVPGLDSFNGAGGVVHSFRYKNPDKYRGMRVLVCGCAISALEIASDLAMLGAAKVVSCYRRQRYVLPKFFAGVPTDHIVFTRYNAFSSEVFPPEYSAENLKQLVLQSNGSPETCGAFKPAASITDAGITLSQYFLPLVAERRIMVKPWIHSIEGPRVTFDDETNGEFDAIIFATGYDLSLPCLSKEIRDILALDDSHIDLYKYTLHPALPGLAFLGMFDQTGPYLPVLEVQARWVAYMWAGLVATPDTQEVSDGIIEYRKRRGSSQKTAMHKTALLFSRAAGVEPSLHDLPELQRALLFGPLSTVSFRLTGPDRIENAAEVLLEDANEFGAMGSAEFRPEEMEQLRALDQQRRSHERKFSAAGSFKTY